MGIHAKDMKLRKSFHVALSILWFLVVFVVYYSIVLICLNVVMPTDYPLEAPLGLVILKVALAFIVGGLWTLLTFGRRGYG